jgi:hypothetical protein
VTLVGYVTSSVTWSPRERVWQRLVVSMEGYAKWDDVPAQIKRSLCEEAEKARTTAGNEVGSTHGGHRLWESAWTPRSRRRYRQLDLTTGMPEVSESENGVVLGQDSDDLLVVSEALAYLKSVQELGPSRWRNGKPAQGAPRAGEQTLLRLERVRERLHEEGSAEALRDRRPLPPGILLPRGHGRKYGRNSRPAPRKTLLGAAVQAGRERFRVTREAEWASLRLQGHAVREIAERACVSASTVSETGAVRLASSLMETALAILAVESLNKAELAGKLGVDPQRAQRAARGVQLMPDTGPEPPPDADVVDTKPWNLRTQTRGVWEGEPPSLPELAMGMEHDRAVQFAKLVQLVADSFVGREQTMLFRREEPHVQRLRRDVTQRYFGGHRHFRSRCRLDGCSVGAGLGGASASSSSAPRRTSVKSSTTASKSDA